MKATHIQSKRQLNNIKINQVWHIRYLKDKTFFSRVKKTGPVETRKKIVADEKIQDLLITNHYVLINIFYCWLCDTVTTLYSHKTGVAHTFIIMAWTVGASSSHTNSLF